MNPFVHEFSVNLRNGKAVERARKELSQGDAYADKLVVHVQDGGTDVDLDGVGVIAKVIRYDGRTVPLTGTVEDGAACIVLDADCYSIPGDIRVTMCLTAGDMVQTVLVLLLNVATSETEIVVDNGVIGDLTAILGAIAEMQEATEAAKEAVAVVNASVVTSMAKIDEAVSRIDDVVVTTPSTNLYNPDDPDYVTGKYLNASTGAASSSGSNFMTTGYIDVSEHVGGYVIARYNDGGSVERAYIRYACFYDSDKVYLGSGTAVTTQKISAQVPDGAYYARLTLYTTYTEFDQQMIAAAPTVAEAIALPYEPYYPPFVSLRMDETLTDAQMPANAKAVGDAIKLAARKIYSETGVTASIDTLAAGTMLTIEEFPRILKNGQKFGLCCKFSEFGASDHIKVGFFSQNSTYQGYLQIDATHIYWYAGTTPSQFEKQAHGLTLESFVNVVVSIEEEVPRFTLTLNTLGGTYTYTQTPDTTRTLTFGHPSVQATMDLTGVTLSASSSTFMSPVWCIGDSYFGNEGNRIFGKLRSFGYTGNALFAGVAGMTSKGGYEQLELMLNYGIPKVLVWYLGMNDSASIVSDIYPQLVSKCDELGITLVFNRIPLVPARLAANQAVHEFVLGSGKRYIDSYDAVGCNAEGVWYDGYNEDGVHPSSAGAAALASRMLIDVPELMAQRK